ncbi:hypothetical protein FOA43_002883 [Brettanomyces nanus]|uniref:Uncharacterized protein n=1 Tax=Eeniella nana TaxID=13502 RepID=A0A875S3K2_EENNA|nr:uncharacterized protein FOA43_002883 [Brettanomyces nanus]QPG75528.1 hypothetical protein FOA43_002883 [Brettanomyces nanus]
MVPRKTRTKLNARVNLSTIKGRETSFEPFMMNGILMKWPHSETLTPEEMAADGFYYDPTYSHQDGVTCFYCKKKEHDWMGLLDQQLDMDDGIQRKPPIIRHLESSPNCPNARLLGARFECEHTTDFHWERDDLFQDPMNSAEIRIKTFIGWPYKKKKGFPGAEELAANGFYYLGYDKGDDAVTCLYCGVSLEGWEEGDSVIEEHKARCLGCYVFHYKEKKEASDCRNSSLYRMSLRSKKREIVGPEIDLQDDMPDMDVNNKPSYANDTSRPLKVDEHGLAYEEIPDEGYLDESDDRNILPSEPVNIPASSLNELSDFYIEPSVSGPSTFFHRSRDNTSTLKESKGVEIPKELEEVEESAAPEAIEEPMDDITDYNDYGDANVNEEKQLVLRKPDSTRDLVEAIKEEVRQEVIKQMIAIHGREAESDGDKKKKHKHKRKHKEKKEKEKKHKKRKKGRKGGEKEAAVTIKEIPKEKLDNDTPQEKVLAPLRTPIVLERSSGNLQEQPSKKSIKVKEEKLESPAASPAVAFPPIYIKRETSPAVDDSSSSILPVKRHFENDSMLRMHRQARKMNDGSVIPSDDPLSFTSEKINHLKVKKRQLKETDIKMNEEQKTEQPLQDNEPIEEQTTEQPLQDNEQIEEQKTEQALQDNEQMKEALQKVQTLTDVDSDILLENVPPSDEFGDAKLRSSPVATPKAVNTFDDYVSTVVDEVDEHSDNADELLAELTKNQSTPYGKGTKKRSSLSPRTRPSMDLKKKLKMSMGEFEEKKSEGEKPDAASSSVSHSSSPSTAATSTTSSWEPINIKDTPKYCQDLEEAAVCLKQLLSSEYRVLSEDMDGGLTDFIGEMPPEELGMTIKEWLEHRAEQAAIVIRQKTAEMKKQFEADALRALQVLEKMPCDD